MNDAKKYQERKKGYRFSSKESQREEKVAGVFSACIGNE
jgi:hypothetical protein